jgi:hypothetical protein
MRFYIFTALFFICLLHSAAQSSSVSGTSPINNKYNSAPHQIHWKEPIEILLPDDRKERVLNFTSAQYITRDQLLPRYYQDVQLDNLDGEPQFFLVNTVYEPLSENELPLLRSVKLSTEVEIENLVHKVKKQKRGGISFIPLRKNPTTGKVEKLMRYELNVSSHPNKQTSDLYFLPKKNSVLQTGEWYKISLTKDGVYKLSYYFFKQLGMNPDAINPKNICIYGNGGGMLPSANSIPRPDDLLENAIVVKGENDGVFNKEDYVLFYAQGPQQWKYSEGSVPAFQHVTHLYSDSAYYFIHVDQHPGKRILQQPSSTASPTHLVSSFDDYALHEHDDRNLINSGGTWYGEYFDHISSYDFSFQFPFIEQAPATVQVAMAGRLENEMSHYKISCQSGSALLSIAGYPTKSYDYAREGKKSFSFVPSSADLTVNVTKQTMQAIAWLDYIEVNVRRKLTMTGHQLLFRDAGSVGAGHVARYLLDATLQVEVWDITDPANVRSQALIGTGTKEFVLPSDTLKQFIAFTGQSYLLPEYSGKVENQNLHSLSNKDFIIVSHPDFLTEAKQLAALHEQEDKLSTIVVTPQQIYNEFSSGARDITAIRDFIRMFYNRATTPSELPKYLLLVGDGSFDNKKNNESNTNFIPVYESELSLNYANSFVSDDYYGLLDDDEGTFVPDSKEAIDIGIGRFPVKSKSEAGSN